MVKLLAIDLDDTCLNGQNQISINTMSALKEAVKRGIEVVFVTGRSFSALPSQLENESFYRYVITSNGACVTDRQNNQILYQSLIDTDTALSLLGEAQQARLGLSAHIANEHIVQGKGLYLLGTMVYGNDSRKTICVNSIREYVQTKSDRIEQLQFFFFTKSEKRSAERLIAAYPQLNGPLGGFYVEFVSKETTKGNALEWLYNRLKLDKYEVACIGDGENDIPMFLKSGLCFAVENACDRLKMIANELVPSNDEDGVAEAIDQILRNKFA